MKDLIFFLSGLVFALGLGISGMTDPAKVSGFLNVTGAWDPTLLFVMGGALAIFMPAWFFRIRGMARPLVEERFHVPPHGPIEKSLILGAVIFGAGWGLAGYCPGPALTALAGGSVGVLVLVAAMFAGSFLFHKINQRGG